MAKEFKFSVEDLADKLGVEPASARIKLRNAGIKPQNGNRYGWTDKADLESTVEKLKAEKPKAAANPAAKKDDKKSSKAGAKAPAKKASKK